MGGMVWRTQDTEDLVGAGSNGIVSWRSWSTSGGWNPPLSDPAIDLGTIGTGAQLVSRTPDTLDLFVIGSDGGVWSRFWNTAQGWNAGGFFPISPGGPSSPSTRMVSAVSRAPDNLDLFAIGSDGVVRSTFWTAEGGWNPWFTIEQGIAFAFDPLTQNVYATSRSPDAIELYVLGPDPTVFWWTFWTTSGGWDPGGWVKVQPTRPISAAQGVSVVSRTPDTLDAFAIGPDGAVWSTFWNKTSGWNPWGWFKLASGTSFDPASPQGVSVVTREAETLDVFVIGSDNSVWSTFWNAATGWAQDWFRIGTANIFDHTTQQVSAISRYPAVLELFAIGINNRVWSTFWTATEGWLAQGWYEVPGTTLFDNATQQVSVVSRTLDTLDLFAIGFDGAVWSTFRNEANGWAEGWFPIASGTTFDHTQDKLTVISRAPDKLDLFVVRADGSVWSTFWNAADGWFGSWFQLGSVSGDTGRISAVSRTPDTIDLFVAERGVTNVWSIHWDAAEGWSPGGWFLMYPNEWYLGGTSNYSVVAISRTADDIDLFIMGGGFAGGPGGDSCVSTFWTSARGGWSPSGWFPIIPYSIVEPAG